MSELQPVFMTQAAADRFAALPHTYLMQWTGGAFPQNGAVGAQFVGSIHGGVVLSKEGERLGICEWLITFDKDTLRQLVIATNAQATFNPDGSPCKQVEVVGPPATRGGSK